MKNANRNVRIYARNNGNSDGFNIYIDRSGQSEWLITHCHNELLFSMLKDGVYLDDIKRQNPIKWVKTVNMSRKRLRKHSDQLCGMVSNLLNIVDDYLWEATEA